MSGVVKIFLASPGDLVEERRVVRARADHFNRMWADQFGIFFRVVGWEDLPPVAQRPQARINRDADDCHLFIGMMGARWGSSSGAYSSGFEEEYSSAHSRWKTSGVPEIALFFKAIDATLMNDPGPQLSKVLQFKRSIAEGKELLYKEFTASSDLADFVDSVLAEYAKTKQAKSASSTQSEPTKDAATASEPGGDQAADASSIVAALAAARDLAEGDSSVVLDRWGELRLWLYATATYGSSRDHISVGVHEVNLAYIKREEWKLTNGEEWMLQRAMVADTYRYAPGWYWLAGGGLESLRFDLWLMCLGDDNVKKGAALLLSNDVVLSNDASFVRDFFGRALLDPTTGPHVCKLAARVGSPEHLDALAEALPGAAPAMQTALASAELSIKLRHLPDQVSVPTLMEYVNRGATGAAASVAARTRGNDTAELIAALPLGDGREALVQAFFEAGALSSELASELLSDPSKRVREIAVHALLTHGRRFSRTDLQEIFGEPASRGLMSLLNSVDTDALLKESLRLAPVDELRAMVDFFDRDGLIAVEVLVDLHWGACVEDVAKELDSAFQRLLDQSESTYRAATGVSRLAIWSKDGSNLIEYKRAELIAVALTGVSKHGHQQAEEWANRYVGVGNSPKIRAAAYEILLGLGALIAYDESLVKFPELPAGVSARLVPRILSALGASTQIVEAIASHTSREVLDALELALAETWNASTQPMLESLLLSASDKTREFAATTLAHRLPAGAIIDAINRYVSLPSYFYNVVGILDAAAYAPSPFREALLIHGRT